MVKQNTTKGECTSRKTSQCLSYQQLIATTTLGSTQTKEKINIYHETCKSNYVI